MWVKGIGMEPSKATNLIVINGFSPKIKGVYSIMN